NSSLSAPGGQLNLASVAGPGMAIVNDFMVDAPSNSVAFSESALDRSAIDLQAQPGGIEIADSFLNVTSAEVAVGEIPLGGGALFVKGGQVTISGSSELKAHSQSLGGLIRIDGMSVDLLSALGYFGDVTTAGTHHASILDSRGGAGGFIR